MSRVQQTCQRVYVVDHSVEGTRASTLKFILSACELRSRMMIDRRNIIIVRVHKVTLGREMNTTPTSGRQEVFWFTEILGIIIH